MKLKIKAPLFALWDGISLCRWDKTVTEMRINEPGRILKGKYAGWTVKIEEDQGSYYILIYEDREGGEGYDDWVENAECLQRYWKNVGYKVQWGPVRGLFLSLINEMSPLVAQKDRDDMRAWWEAFEYPLLLEFVIILLRDSPTPPSSSLIEACQQIADLLCMKDVAGLDALIQRVPHDA